MERVNEIKLKQEIDKRLDAVFKSDNPLDWTSLLFILSLAQKDDKNAENS